MMFHWNLILSRDNTLISVTEVYFPAFFGEITDKSVLFDEKEIEELKRIFRESEKPVITDSTSMEELIEFQDKIKQQVKDARINIHTTS